MIDEIAPFASTIKHGVIHFLESGPKAGSHTYENQIQRRVYIIEAHTQALVEKALIDMPKGIWVHIWSTHDNDNMGMNMSEW